MLSGLFSRRSCRTLQTGLLIVSAKPIAIQPHAPAIKTLNELVNGANMQLKMYNAVEENTKNCVPRLALSVIHDLAKFRADALPLAFLPPQAKAPARPTPHSLLDPEFDDTDEQTLPPELQPVLQDDGIPPLPPGEDPWEEWDSREDEKDEIDYDALDLKNMPDFDPYQDHESKHYSIDVLNAWWTSDEDDCSKGARPRLYENLDISNKTSAGVYSNLIEPNPIGGEQPRLLF